MTRRRGPTRPPAPSRPLPRRSASAATATGTVGDSVAAPTADPGAPDPGAQLVTDHEHAAVLVSVDFLAACLALPLSLLVLSGISPAHINSGHMLLHNLAQDALFPVAVVLALAVSGLYRSARRALQPSTFTEMKSRNKLSKKKCPVGPFFCSSEQQRNKTNRQMA